MSAYVIANVEITDREAYPEYAKRAAPTVVGYGGRYLVRGGPAIVKEGDLTIHRLVILEFPSMAQALAWYDSPEYAPVKAIRHAAARSEFTFVEGVPAT